MVVMFLFGGMGGGRVNVRFLSVVIVPAARDARYVLQIVVDESCGGRTGCRWDGASGPISVRENLKKLGKLRHSHCLAPRREHVVGQMVLVVLRPVVGSHELLNGTPLGLDIVYMIPGSRVNKRYRVVHGTISVTHRPNIPIRDPAITDDCSTWFDPSTYIFRQCGSSTLRHGN
jgi:hypothetical protein